MASPLKVPSPLAAQRAATGIGPAPASWCFSPPLKHPTFVKKHNMAIRPNKNWIATKVNFQLYARLQPIRSRLPLPERLCAGSATFLADLAFVPNDTIDSLACPELVEGQSQSAIHPRQMRQERYWQNEDYPISRASPPGFSPR
jgi:hypothetical protein